MGTLTKSKKIIAGVFVFLSSTLTVSLHAETLCNVKSCVESINLIDTESNFNNNFRVIQGDHVGTHEHQKYESSQVLYSQGTVQLKAIPAAPFDCKSNGNFGISGNVISGTCKYISGAINTRGRFDINKKNNALIDHGAVEIEATIAANGNETLSKGLWPALWMMSNSLDDTFMIDGKPWETRELWPNAMEIDIMEYMQGSSDVLGTMHYGLYTGKSDPITSWNYVNNRDNNQVGDWVYVPGDDVLVYNSNPSEKHTFGLEWEVNRKNPLVGDEVTLTWYYDGNPYYRYVFSRDPNKVWYKKQKMVRSIKNNDWKVLDDSVCIQAAQWKCPNLFIDSEQDVKDPLAYAMFNSFFNGFYAGYYLNINLAVGGDGVVKGNSDPADDIEDTMTIHSVKRYIIN